MASYTGGKMSMGYVILHCNSGKQKLRVKSSTEVELVDIIDYIPYNIWLIMFMGKHRYPIKDHVLYEENQCEINMLKNDRNLGTGNSRHMHINYFFMIDRADKGKIRAQYCPSEQYFWISLQNHYKDSYLNFLEMYS